MTGHATGPATLARFAAALLRGLSRASLPLRPVAVALARRRRRRAAVGELQALDDRMLADIGLSRGDVALITATAARWVPPPRPPIARLAAGAVVAPPTTPARAANDNLPAAAAARRPSCA